jgi:hypothetical protein
VQAIVTTTDEVLRLSWERALAWRMERHHLVTRAAPSELVRVASDICGLHAQLTSSAELSLWARIDGLGRNAVSEALWQHRTLVKLWAMRGTLHLLPADEIGVWLAALGTQTSYGNSGHPELAALTEAVGRALDGRALTREELAREVERDTGSAELAEWVRFSWGSYLKAASFQGLLCFAPSTGTSVRFTTPATWLAGEIARPDPSAAFRDVTRRFLGAYGPISVRDFAVWWGGYGPARGRLLRAILGEDAVEVAVEGQRAWVPAEDVRAIAAATPPNTARLLPAFDPWVIGASRGVAALLDPRQTARVYRPQGWISPVVLVNGRMVGVWKHTRKGRRLLVEIDPFDELPAWARAQIEFEAERLAAFLDCELDLCSGRYAPGDASTRPSHAQQE